MGGFGTTPCLYRSLVLCWHTHLTIKQLLNHTGHYLPGNHHVSNYQLLTHLTLSIVSPYKPYLWEQVLAWHNLLFLAIFLSREIYSVGIQLERFRWKFLSCIRERLGHLREQSLSEQTAYSVYMEAAFDAGRRTNPRLRDLVP